MPSHSAAPVGKPAPPSQPLALQYAGSTTLHDEVQASQPPPGHHAHPALTQEPQETYARHGSTGPSV
jgi:hypothetical protein